MDFSWDDELNQDAMGFPALFPADCLERALFAKNLTSFLTSEGANRSFVLNLNAPWGSGKSYIINRWAITLKQHKHSVVYFDSWKHDHSENALACLLSEIKNQMIDGFSDGLDRDMQNLKGAVKKASGKTLEIMMNAGFELLKSQTGIDFNTKPEEFSLMIDHAGQKIKKIEEFKQGLSKLILDRNNAAKVDSNTTAFVFIDELDRCRPSFAIEVLENIKHLFEIKNLVFVIATDTEQLQHSIKSIYGDGFDSQKYLSRFFNRSIALPTPDLASFLSTNKDYGNHFPKVPKEPWILPYQFVEDDFIDVFSSLATHLKVDLRTVERILDQLYFSISIAKEHGKSINVILIACLLIMKEPDSHPFYKKFLLKDFTPNNNTSYGLGGTRFTLGKPDDIPLGAYNIPDAPSLTKIPLEEYLLFSIYVLDENIERNRILNLVQGSYPYSFAAFRSDKSNPELTYDEYINILEFATKLT